MVSLESFLSQGEGVSALLRQLRAGQLTHALLITGEAGLGKWTLAKLLAAAILGVDLSPRRPSARETFEEEFEEDFGGGSGGFSGKASEKEAAKDPAEEWLAHPAHPDLVVLEKGSPLADTDVKSVIPVTDIEEMSRRLSLRGTEGLSHVVLIHRASDLSEESQNKLLKTLEEPPEGTYFLLTCREADLLLPTVVSRCRPLKLHSWPEKEMLHILAEHGYTGEAAREALREAEGSPGRALYYAGDENWHAFRQEAVRDFLSLSSRSGIYRVSARWKDRREEAEPLFSLLESCFGRMMAYSLSSSPEETPFPGCPPRWRSFAEEAGAAEYVGLLEAVRLARQRTGNSVNFQAVLEQMLLSFMEALGS